MRIAISPPWSGAAGLALLATVFATGVAFSWTRSSSPHVDRDASRVARAVLSRIASAPGALGDRARVSADEDVPAGMSGLPDVRAKNHCRQDELEIVRSRRQLELAQIALARERARVAGRRALWIARDRQPVVARSATCDGSRPILATPRRITTECRAAR